MPPVGFPADAGAVAHVLVEHLGARCTVGGDDGHHLQRVRRLRPGEPVTAADGDGHWRPYVVAAVGSGTVELEATDAGRDEPPLEPALAVAFGVTKGEQPELVVGQLTQLGVDRIVVVATARSVARWTGERAQRAGTRLGRVAREAAMQARRSRVPPVSFAAGLDELLAHPGLVVAERGGAPVAEIPLPVHGEWLLVVGPEGGFDDRERRELGEFPHVALAPYQLRATTAATVATGLFTSRRRPAIFSRGTEP